MDDEIDIREYLEVVLKRWKTIALITLGTGIIVLVFNLLQPPIYEARTTILVKSGGGGSALNQISGLAGLAGINLPSSGGSLSELTEVLQSRAVAAKVLEDLDLRERVEGWNSSRYSDQKLINKVQQMLGKPKTKGNLLELTVEESNPALAADIANGYVDALSYYWNKLNYTEARKKKDYIESQLPRVEKELKQAEKKFKKFTILTPQGSSVSSGIMGAVSGSRSQGIEVARLSREMEIQNTVYTMLRKEYESVRLEESKEIPPFSIVDRAAVPESKSKPKIKMNTMIGLVMGMFGGVIYAFIQERKKK